MQLRSKVDHPNFHTVSPALNGIVSFSGPIVFTTTIGGLSFTADVQGGEDVGTGSGASCAPVAKLT